MRLIECYIDGFGRLKQTKYDFNNGLNCIYGSNGSGKTTFTYFITAMLYGLGDSRRSDLEENDRKRFAPWDGGKFGGSLTFEACGRTMRVERSFGTKASEDSFKLFELPGGAVLTAPCDPIGESLFGIDRLGFERTVFLSERGLGGDLGAGGVSARLSSLSDVEGDLSEVWNALERLDEKRKYYHKRGGGGEISALKRRTEEYDFAIAEMQRDLDTLAELKRQLSDIEGEIAKIDSSKARLQDTLINGAEGAVERCTDILKIMDDERRVVDRETKYFRGHLPPDGNNDSREMSVQGSRTRPIFTAAVVLGLLMSVVGILLGAMIYAPLYGIGGLGIALAVCGIVMLLRKKRSEQGRDSEDRRHLEEYRRAMESLSELDKEYKFIRSHTQMADREELKKRLSYLEEASDNKKKDAAVLRTKCQSLEIKLSQLDQIEQKRAAVKQKQQACEDDLRIIKLASAYLKKAYENMTDRYLGVTRARFGYYASLISRETGEYYIDASFNLRKSEGSTTHASEGYSKGTRELYALALRLALIDALYKDGEAPPIILDDPFSLFDDERLKQASQLIKDISNQRQIIYTTPHKSRLIK